MKMYSVNLPQRRKSLFIKLSRDAVPAREQTEKMYYR